MSNKSCGIPEGIAICRIKRRILGRGRLSEGAPFSVAIFVCRIEIVWRIDEPMRRLSMLQEAFS